MKNKYILILLLVISIFMSCTKIIELDLNDSESKVIIEANLIEGTNDFVVEISRTSNYFDNAAPLKIDNAIVTLTDGTTTQTLNNLGNGEYSLTSYSALENTAYTLNVTDGADVYTATSTMPEKIELDTVTYIYQPASAFSDSGYSLFLNFQDVANVKNYYRGTFNVNGEEIRGIDDLYIFDDGFTDGNYIQIPAFGEIYQAGDVVVSRLYSLNEVNYKFYNTLSTITSNGGGGASAAPANPDNNWSNGALGNFNTICISTFSSVVQ